MTGITLTIDLEDPSGNYTPDRSYIEITNKLLDFCDELQCKATFFVVGRIANVAPSLLKNIAARDHEIAYHTHNHVPLTQENPKRFMRESRGDKERLEQITGKQIIGFRAPGFSLTPKTFWVLDILKELGFRYSSSVMPTRISRYGFPNTPTIPFKWPNGIIELPLPVASLKFMRIPYLGGVYLYALPFSIVQYFIDRANTNECLWTYTHPFDFDINAPFERHPNTPMWISLVMWLLRNRAENKIRHIMATGKAKTLGERIDLMLVETVFKFTE